MLDASVWDNWRSTSKVFLGGRVACGWRCSLGLIFCWGDSACDMGRGDDTSTLISCARVTTLGAERGAWGKDDVLERLHKPKNEGCLWCSGRFLGLERWSGFSLESMLKVSQNNVGGKEREWGGIGGIGVWRFRQQGLAVVSVWGKESWMVDKKSVPSYLWPWQVADDA